MNKNSIPNNPLDFFISYNDWSRLIRVKREKRLRILNDANIGNESNGIMLDTTKPSKLFNNLIINLSRRNIFDLSRISYLAILFLDPFITPHLKYYLEKDSDIVITSSINNDTDKAQRDYLPPLDNRITHILACVVELLVFIELQLNILLFTLQMQLGNHLDNSIPSSTLLLLVFNIITKLGSLPLNMLEYISKEKNILADLLKIINPKLQMNNKKINELLDKFILDINMNYEINHKINGHPQGDRLWQLCKSHILDIARVNLEIFGSLLDIIIKLLILENPTNHDKLLSIRNSIFNFLEMEINLFDNKLEIMPS